MKSGCGKIPPRRFLLVDSNRKVDSMANMNEQYLTEELQSKQNEVNSQTAAARQATQDAAKAQAELNVEIRNHFTK